MKTYEQGVIDGLTKAAELANRKYQNTAVCDKYTSGAEAAYADVHDTLLDMIDAEPRESNEQ